MQAKVKSVRHIFCLCEMVVMGLGNNVSGEAESPLGTFLFVPNACSATRQQRLIYALARHLSIHMFEVAETSVAVVRESWRR